MSEKYSVITVLRGDYYCDSLDQFSQVHVEFEFLSEWAGIGHLMYPDQERFFKPEPEPGALRRIWNKLTGRSGQFGERQMTVGFESPSASAKLADGTTITLSTDHPISVGRHKFEAESYCYLHISCPGPKTLDEMGKLVLRCQNLVSLLSDTPNAATEYRVGPQGEQLLELGSTFVFIRRGVTPNLHRAQMLALRSLDDFAPLIEAWFKVYDESERSLNTYFGLAYAPPTYSEIRYVTSVIAAEGMHSRLFPMSEDDKKKLKARKAAILSLVRDPLNDKDFDWVESLLRNAGGSSLNHGLRLLWDYAQISTKQIVPDGEAWARAISGERNALSHPSRRKMNDTQLFYATESVLRILAIVTTWRLWEVSAVNFGDPAKLRSSVFLVSRLREQFPAWGYVDQE